MKRAIAAKGRKGSPPLPRQRLALRMVQFTLVGITFALSWLAYEAWVRYSGRDSGGSKEVRFDEVLGLSLAAVIFFSLALWMGFRTVRGPQPPTLD